MFKSLKKITFFLSAALSLGFAVSASAQILQNVGDMSAAEFAQQAGTSEGNKVAAALESADAGKIICGYLHTQCDRETEVCLKCVVTKEHRDATSFGLGNRTNTIEYGKCVPKTKELLEGKFFTSQLRNYWPEDNQCQKDSYSSYNGITDKTSSVITVEHTSWLAEGVDKMLFSKNVQKHPFTDSNGKVYHVVMSETPTIHYAGEDGSFSGCEVLPVKLYNMKKCFFCPLAELIYDAANEVTSEAFSHFARPFLAVVIVMFALWLALVALQQVFSMTKQDAPKFLAAIVRQGFKVLIVFFLLTNSAYLFQYFIIPVLDGGLKMGTEIQTVVDDSSQEEAPSQNEKQKEEKDKSYYNTPIDGENLYDKIENYLTEIQSKISALQAVGTTLFCVGGHEIITTDFDVLKKGLSMMLLGGLLTAFGFLLTISFAFYFLDAVLQLAVLGAMLPFMIAGWPFKATAQYASTGFKMLMNTFFVMFFTGFVVSVNLQLIDSALGYSQSKQEETGDLATQQLSNNSTTGHFGLSFIAESINNQNIERLREATDIGGAGFMLLLFSCLFGFKFIAQTTPLANTLSSGGFKPIASKIGTMAASSVKGMATKAANPTAKAVADQYHAAGGVVGIVGGGAKNVAGGVKAIGGGVQKVGSGVSKAGKAMIAGGGVIGKVAGAALVGAGAAAQAAGAVTKAAGSATKKVSEGIRAGAKKLHSAARRKPGK